MTSNVSEHSVLVVDDDLKISSFVSNQLRLQGYHVETAMNGQEGIDKSVELLPDLILLDITMPVMDGIEALKRLREWYEGPIIILSATSEESKKVEALDFGADDYLTKPFGIQELLARVRSSIRRMGQVANSRNNESPVVEFSDVTIDLAKRVVQRNGDEVSLTRTEYELLSALASNAGKVITHRELLHQVWGPEYGDETEYLRTFIKQLRRKLEPDPSRPAYLLTQPGLGYRLAV